MKNNIKIIISLVLITLLSACVSTPVELNRGAFATDKVKELHVTSLEQSISIELSDSATNGGAAAGGLLGVLVGGAIDAGTNSNRKKKFAPVLDSIGDYDSNAKLLGTFNEKLGGKAFSDQVKINTEFTNKDKKKKLIPNITPTIIMAANYSVLNILLNTRTVQLDDNDKNYLGYYASQQLVEDDGLEVDKEKNRQFWLDNPEILIAKIEAGIEDVVQQFVDDFNGPSTTEKELNQDLESARGEQESDTGAN